MSIKKFNDLIWDLMRKEVVISVHALDTPGLAKVKFNHKQPLSIILDTVNLLNKNKPGVYWLVYSQGDYDDEGDNIFTKGTRK